MNHPGARYRILIVDDEEDVHEGAEQWIHALDPRIEIRSATTYEKALELADHEFFHMAFVDLRLKRQEKGVNVMRYLNIHSPACKIIIMTSFMREANTSAEVLSFYGPSFQFEGVVDKTAGNVDWFGRFVKPAVREWNEHLLEVHGLDEVVAAVLSKATRTERKLAAVKATPVRLRRDPIALGDEVEWILMGIFGVVGEQLPGARSQLELSLMPRGFSASVVATAQPGLRFASVGRLVSGNQCVVKIGAKTEIRAEARQYERIVKYGRALEHRVELLGCADGDALAGICYSFAGGDARGLRTLDELIADRGTGTWRTVIRKIFAPEASNWFAVAAEVEALRTYFTEVREIKLECCFDRFEDWIADLARYEFVRRDGQSLRIGPDTVLTLPTRQMLAATGMRTRVPACLIHGDLHGGNVLVDNQDRAYFIDFRNSGVGPRLIDFAALQTTARFLDAETYRPAVSGWPRVPEPTRAEAVVGTLLREGEVLERDFSGPERWVSVVAELDRARLHAFPDSDYREACWTNFAYCLSMFRFMDMEWYRKLRLLTWLSAMTVALSGPCAMP